MISVKADFENRKSEIDEYFGFVDIIYSEEKEAEIKFKRLVSHRRRRKFDISDKLQKVLIANSFLLLYNLIEATVRNSLDEIFEDMQNNGVEYIQLTEKLKKIFLVQKNQNLKEGAFSMNTLNKQVSDLIDFVLNNDTVVLEKDKLDFSGNLDARKIRGIAGDYGFDAPAVNGEHLRTIKVKRNHLAHGDFSFSDIGKDFTISELIGFKEQTFTFLDEVIKNIEKFIADEEYVVSI